MAMDISVDFEPPDALVQMEMASWDSSIDVYQALELSRHERLRESQLAVAQVNSFRAQLQASMNEENITSAQNYSDTQAGSPLVASAVQRARVARNQDEAWLENLQAEIHERDSSYKSLDVAKSVLFEILKYLEALGLKSEKRNTYKNHMIGRIDRLRDEVDAGTYAVEPFLAIMKKELQKVKDRYKEIQDEKKTEEENKQKEQQRQQQLAKQQQEDEKKRQQQPKQTQIPSKPTENKAVADAHNSPTQQKSKETDPREVWQQHIHAVSDIYQDPKAFLKNFSKIPDPASGNGSGRLFRALNLEVSNKLIPDSQKLNEVTQAVVQRFRLLDNNFAAAVGIPEEKIKRAAFFKIIDCVFTKFKSGQTDPDPKDDVTFVYAELLGRIGDEMPEFNSLLEACFSDVCPALSPYLTPVLPGDDNSVMQYFENNCVRLMPEMADTSVKGKAAQVRKGLLSVAGYTRIFAAGFQRSLDQDPGGRAWRWLVTFLKLDIIWPGVSPAVLEQFLLVCGHMLAKMYKSQFFKLLECIHREWLPHLFPEG
eukprot:m.178581 g.178581  ORF g.178581 m.178581 type:complete len:539 (+) comp15471_c0_seq3:248-1864(+)